MEALHTLLFIVVAIAVFVFGSAITTCIQIFFKHLDYKIQRSLDEKAKMTVEQKEYRYLSQKKTRTPKDFARIAELEKQLRK